VALQIAIPASYYLRDADHDDERFAWRMFSGVRLKRCTALVREHRGGKVAPVTLRGVLHSSWIHALERGRVRVIEQFLRSRCDRGAESVLMERRCQSVERGRDLEPEIYQLNCQTHAFQVGGAP
jgi:hypothetical protein